MKVVQLTQKYVRVGLIIVLYSAAKGCFGHDSAGLNAEVEL